MSGPRAAPEAVAAYLALREPADARARAEGLIDPLTRHLGPAGPRPRRVHDLGAGTGSGQRWLAGRLTGPQHWVLHDRGPDRLAVAVDGAATTALDGTPVTVETRVGELTDLTRTDLADADLVTASALLDTLTGAEVRALATRCAGRAVLWALTVTGSVVLDPPDDLDDAVAAAFDAYQRRDGRLGPDAAEVAADALARVGHAVRIAPSPWHLGPSTLLAAWLDGRIDAAADERPDLPLAGYRARRAAALADGSLHAVVDHRDLLGVPS